MRHPAFALWCLAVWLLISIAPAAGATSKSQTIQVTIIIPAHIACLTGTEDVVLPTHTCEVPSPDAMDPKRVTATLRDGTHPALLYTYTDPN